MCQFMKFCGAEFFGAREKLGRGQGDPIGKRAVESLRSSIANLGPVGHSGNDLE